MDPTSESLKERIRLWTPRLAKMDDKDKIFERIREQVAAVKSEQEHRRKELNNTTVARRDNISRTNSGTHLIAASQLQDPSKESLSNNLQQLSLKDVIYAAENTEYNGAATVSNDNSSLVRTRMAASAATLAHQMEQSNQESSNSLSLSSNELLKEEDSALSGSQASAWSFLAMLQSALADEVFSLNDEERRDQQAGLHPNMFCHDSSDLDDVVLLADSRPYTIVTQNENNEQLNHPCKTRLKQQHNDKDESKAPLKKQSDRARSGEQELEHGGRDLDVKELRLLQSVSINLAEIHNNRQRRKRKLEGQRTVQLLTFVSKFLVETRRTEEQQRSNVTSTD